jgi:hypothetical protein
MLDIFSSRTTRTSGGHSLTETTCIKGDKLGISNLHNHLFGISDVSRKYWIWLFEIDHLTFHKYSSLISRTINI